MRANALPVIAVEPAITLNEKQLLTTARVCMYRPADYLRPLALCESQAVQLVPAEDLLVPYAGILRQAPLHLVIQPATAIRRAGLVLREVVRDGLGALQDGIGDEFRHLLRVFCV